mmetsp:Transcript_47353/g.112574  ORF Transcript_47353/g.112574 Transcript_47353/m.112574 type:complete len:272 (+) Transcript_47353:758-1573(+)
MGLGTSAWATYLDRWLFGSLSQCASIFVAPLKHMTPSLRSIVECFRNQRPSAVASDTTPSTRPAKRTLGSRHFRRLCGLRKVGGPSASRRSRWRWLARARLPPRHPGGTALCRSSKARGCVFPAASAGMRKETSATSPLKVGEGESPRAAKHCRNPLWKLVAKEGPTSKSSAGMLGQGYATFWDFSCCLFFVARHWDTCKCVARSTSTTVTTMARSSATQNKRELESAGGARRIKGDSRSKPRTPSAEELADAWLLVTEAVRLMLAPATNP